MVPALMFHSVAPASSLAPHGWLQDISEEPGLLEATLRLWKRQGYRTLTSEELDAYLSRSRSLPRKSLLMTCDDGYLDNWTILEPLLAQYGFHAVVFMSTDFIDPRPVKRSQVQPGDSPSEAEVLGYLSWDEMRAMESRQTIEIQSHARTHTWHFVSDKIVDYYRPEIAMTRSGSLTRFLWLNSHTERKPFTLSELHDEAVPWGTPIYRFEPALIARRFFPDEAEAGHLVQWTTAHGGKALFGRADWREILDGQAARWRAGRASLGHHESVDAHRARIRDELEGSRRLLSEGLGKSVDFMSFPQGGMNDLVEEMTREIGYRIWTMPSRLGRRGNVPGAEPGRVYRCGRGYGLFGPDSSRRAKLLSHGIVLKRYSGSRLAHAVTAATSLTRRMLGRR